MTTMTPLSKTDPKSLYNLCPMDLRRLMDSHVTQEDFGKSEDDYVAEYGKYPDPLLGRIRNEFWREYDLAQGGMRPINMGNIASRVGMPATRVLSMLDRKHAMAWLMIPPGTYESFLDEALLFGLQRVRRDILGANLMTIKYDSDGKSYETLDHKAAELLLKAVAFLDMRKNGGIVSKNLHVIQSAKDLHSIATPKSIEDIDRRIKELEEKGVIDHAIGVIDAHTHRASTPPEVYVPGIGATSLLVPDGT